MHYVTKLFPACLVALSACGPMPINVAQYNGDSVTIERMDLGPPQPTDPAIVGKAQEACAVNGRQADFASFSVDTDETLLTSYLFYCR